MSFNMRHKHDLVQILSAGGSLVMDAGLKQTSDLIELASAARQGGSKLTLRNLGLRDTQDLVLIAAAGKGAVIFSD